MFSSPPTPLRRRFLGAPLCAPLLPSLPRHRALLVPGYLAACLYVLVLCFMCFCWPLISFPSLPSIALPCQLPVVEPSPHKAFFFVCFSFYDFFPGHPPCVRARGCACIGLAGSRCAGSLCRFGHISVQNKKTPEEGRKRSATRRCKHRCGIEGDQHSDRCSSAHARGAAFISRCVIAEPGVAYLLLFLFFFCTPPPLFLLLWFWLKGPYGGGHLSAW